MSGTKWLTHRFLRLELERFSLQIQTVSSLPTSLVDTPYSYGTPVLAEGESNLRALQLASYLGLQEF